MTKAENLINTARMLEKRSAMLMEQARMEGEVPASAEKFMELLHDEAFSKEFFNCASEAAVKELLDRNGVDFSMEEIDAIMVGVGTTLQKLEENNGELTEEDLEQVAGGWSWGGFFKGIGLGIVVGAIMGAIVVGCIAVSAATGGAGAPLAAAAAAKLIAGTAAVGATAGGIVGGAQEL